jgi:hypothetical protein
LGCWSVQFINKGKALFNTTGHINFEFPGNKLAKDEKKKERYG